MTRLTDKIIEGDKGRNLLMRLVDLHVDIPANCAIFYIGQWRDVVMDSYLLPQGFTDEGEDKMKEVRQALRELLNERIVSIVY